MDTTSGLKITPELLAELFKAMNGISDLKGHIGPEPLPLPDLSSSPQLAAATRKTTSAEEHFAARRIPEAHKVFLDAAATLVGQEADVPVTEDGGVKSTLYLNLPDPRFTFELARIYKGIADCLLLMGHREEALVWLEEIFVLVMNLRWVARQPPEHIWMNFHVTHPSFHATRFRAHLTLAQAFQALGNTGQASALRERAYTHLPIDVRDLASIQAQLSREYSREQYLEDMRLRHPEMKALQEQRVIDPALTVRGSWTRLSPARAGRIPHRQAFASFIWNSKLYIAGGEKDAFSEPYRDLWCLDLRAPKAWRELTKYPNSNGRLTDQQMVVVGEKAYLYSGQKKLEYFDLKEEKWGSIKTTMKPDKRVSRDGRWWSVPDEAQEYAMCAVGEVLYVFGGAPATARLGTTLLMRCDLSKRPLQWERLAGTARDDDIPASYDEPGARTYPGMWAEGEGDDACLYVFGGMADRMAARINGQKHPGESAWVCDDLWSWKISEGKWRRERMSGNVPAGRAETALCYNPAIKAAVIFGGYNPTTPTYFKELKCIRAYTYYADTFIFTHPTQSKGKWLSPGNRTDLKTTDTVAPSRAHPTAGKWMQVLTQGFPTYRAQAGLLTDPATGCMFLFGGFTNGDFVASRLNYESKYDYGFADVWELRIDVPGGGFEAVDWEAEARTARAGPWSRCFTCASAGPWKRCGGTCGGKAHFCSEDCQKEGWKTHKKWHNCRVKK